MSSAADPVSSFPRAFGRYTLLSRLGIGGMAEVFRAEQRGVSGFSKEVVIKRILPHLAEDPRFVDMFLREARLAAGINHPNVVQIFDVGEVEGAYYIAMEFVDGLTVRGLARRLWHQGRSLPLEAACGVIADAALGLDVIHRATDPTGAPLHIVHRDISPDNLMVTLRGTTKILDFGIARSKDAKRLTQTGELKGKIPYMPPEQIESRDLDGRTDLYALGVSLYWLLTRSRPFDRNSDLSTLNAIVREPPPPPRAKNPDIPPALEVLILQLLEKDPARRPATGQEVHDRILRAVPSAAVPEALVVEAAALPSTRFLDLDSAPGEPASVTQSDPGLPDTVPVSVVSAQSLAPRLLPEEEPSTRTLIDAGMQRRRAPVAALAIGLVAALGIALALVVVDRDEPAPAQDLPAAPPAPTPPAPEPVRAEPPPAPEPPPEAAPAPEKRRRSFYRRWSVKGPSAVRWLYRGRTVGKGSTTLRLRSSARQVIAYDTRRRVKTTVDLKDGLDYATLPKGKLAFRVHPFARVRLGSEAIGTTPFATLDVTAGTYEAIKLEGPERAETQRAVVRPGKVTVVKADLTK